MCFSLKSPNFRARILWKFCQISKVQKLYLEWFSVVLKTALLGSLFSASKWEIYWATVRASWSVRGARIFRHSLCQNGEKLTLLGEGDVSRLRLKEPPVRWDRSAPKMGSIREGMLRHTPFSDPFPCPVLFCLSSFFL